MKPEDKKLSYYKKSQTKMNYIIFTSAIFCLFFGYLFYKKFFVKVPIIQQSVVSNNEVDAIKLSYKDVYYTMDLPAKVSAVKVSQVRPQVDGVITKQFFREGSFVAKGQPLYEIDPAERIVIKAPISGFISRTYQTVGSLVTKNQTNPVAVIVQNDNMYADVVLSYKDFIEMIEIIKANNINNKNSNKNIDNSNIDKKYLSKDDIKELEQKLNEDKAAERKITQEDDYEDNDEDDIDNSKIQDDILLDSQKDLASFFNTYKLNPKTITDMIANNTKITLNLEDGNADSGISAKLSHIEVISEDETNSVVMRAIFKNNSNLFVSGTTIDVKLGILVKNAIVIPQRTSYVLPSGDLYVWTVENGIAKKKQFKTARSKNGDWIVDDGLKEGDVIIYSGTQKVKEGSVVNVSILNKPIEE